MKNRETLVSMDINEEIVRIVRYHRKGPKRSNHNRPIIVKFDWFGDIKKILAKRPVLKTKTPQLFIIQDWPKEIEDRRRTLLPFMHRAHEARLKAWLIVDKLIVEGKSYTVDNIDTLPDVTKPKKFSTLDTENCYLQYGRYAPFSTFNEEQFVMNKHTYFTIEQAVQHIKALKFKDISSARLILNERDPFLARQLGRKVSNYDIDQWKTDFREIMTEIVKAKIDQHSSPKTLLLETGDKKIGICGLRDNFWGIGLSISGEAAKDHSNWKGENKLGKILSDLRAKYKGEQDLVKDILCAISTGLSIHVLLFIIIILFRYYTVDMNHIFFMNYYY